MIIHTVSVNTSRRVIQSNYIYMNIKNRLGALKTTNVYFNASLVYIIANGIGQGTTLLANIFFTRYMSRSDYGLFSNYYSYVSLLVPFVGLNLYYGLMNAYLDYKDEIHQLRSSLIPLSLIGLIFSTFAMFAIDAAVGLTVPRECILLVVVHSYGFFLVNFYIQSMNMENRYMRKGVMLAIPYILQAALAAVAVIICNTYISRAIGASMGILLCGVIAVILILKDATPSINTDYWKYVLRISLPAIIGSVSAMIMQQCDKVMITSMIGPEANAVYSLVYYIGYILYAVIQATSGAWQVWLYNTLDRRKYDSIIDVQKWYLFFMLVLISGLYMIAPEIIKILSPKDYWCFEYVPPFIVGSYLILMYTINMSVIQYEKRTDVNSAIVTVAAILNIALNYIIIPRFGGVGAAYTSVASYMLIFVISRLYLGVKKEFYYKERSYIINMVFVVTLGCVFYLTMDMIWIRYIVFLFVLLSEGLYVLRNIEDIRNLFGGRIIRLNER